MTDTNKTDTDTRDLGIIDTTIQKLFPLDFNNDMDNVMLLNDISFDTFSTLRGSKMEVNEENIVEVLYGSGYNIPFETKLGWIVEEI